jgi:ParB family transcriptional regulator, chromosome partitioning protein
LKSSASNDTKADGVYGPRENQTRAPAQEPARCFGSWRERDGTEVQALSSTIELAAGAGTDVIRDIGTSSGATMPRGMEGGARAKEQCLKVLDTKSLSSSDSASRSDSCGEDQSMAELVASIASLGIIEPIVVRRVDTNSFVVVAGERRFAAAKRLNLRQVPCVVTQCSDSEALVISLTENLQRSDLDPIQKACALRRLLEDFALTQEQIGKRVGMSQSTIAHYLRLLSLPRGVQRLIGEGALSVGHGKVLAALDDEEEAIDAALDCISKNRSVREFEAWLSSERGKTDKRPSRESLRNKREERELRNGLFLVIKESRDKLGNGTIEIPYCSHEERDWVLNALAELGMRRRTAQSGARPIALAKAQRPGLGPASRFAHGMAGSSAPSM